MEDIREDIARMWPLQHYALVARHLGQFNGAYLVNRPLPAEPWLSTGWFRKMAMQVAPYRSEPLIKSLSDSSLKGLLPDDAADQFVHFWAERDLFLDALDRLPQTFCHLDIFRRNLVARRSADGHLKTLPSTGPMLGNPHWA